MLNYSLATKSRPQFITDLLSSPPAAGSGIHSWLYRCGCVLVPWSGPEERLRILTEAAANCGRKVTDHELLDVVRNAKSDFKPDGISRGLREMMPQRAQTCGAQSWPLPDWNLIAGTAESGAGLADLWEASPLRVPPPARELINMLFPGEDPLLCFGFDKDRAETRLVSEWEREPGWPGCFPFLVPSPMSAKKGRNQAGEVSSRSLENTGPRRWLVAEFDFVRAKPGEKRTGADDILESLAAERNPRTAPDLCAAIILHLIQEGAPVALALHSGRKSCHAWLPVFGADDDGLRPFFRHIRKLGADSASWVRCQLMRVPNGRRPDGTKQSVYYCNPALFAA